MGKLFDAERSRGLVEMIAPERLTRIVDIGANPIGETPYLGLLSEGLCDVWGFEPQADVFADLDAMAGPHEHHVCAAVGDGHRATLHICRGSGFTSLLRPNENTISTLQRFSRGMTVRDKVEIDTRRLDDIVEVPQFDFLKIDVQGSEVAVFQNGSGRLSSAVAVMTEVAAIPLYEDQPLLDAQMSLLGELGFRLHKFMFLKSIRLGGRLLQSAPKRMYRSQISDGDAVFVRGLLEPAGLSNEELKHLAILADGVFDSPDLCVLALSELVGRGVVSEAGVNSYIDRLPGVVPTALET